MMWPMARTCDRTTGSRVVVLVLVLVTSLAGCSDSQDRPPDSDGEPASAALRVRTVSGADALDEGTRTDLEAEVGDVLSSYLVAAFLGDYPRDDFVGSFQHFTFRASRRAVRDVDLLTASGFRDAESVRATRLDARLSFAVDKKDVIGATAAVKFMFEATQDSEIQPIRLRGRFLLENHEGTWSVFGYHVARDDGPARPTGGAS